MSQEKKADTGGTAYVEEVVSHTGGTSNGWYTKKLECSRFGCPNSTLMYVPEWANTSWIHYLCYDCRPSQSDPDVFLQD